MRTRVHKNSCNSKFLGINSKFLGINSFWDLGFRISADDAIDGWRVSLRHHDPQRQNYTEAGFAIENAEAGSAIECFCSRIVMSQTDARTYVVN
jgi:hypothetical protein